MRRHRAPSRQSTHFAPLPLFCTFLRPGLAASACAGTFFSVLPAKRPAGFTHQQRWVIHFPRSVGEPAGATYAISIRRPVTYALKDMAYVAPNRGTWAGSPLQACRYAPGNGVSPDQHKTGKQLLPPISPWHPFNQWRTPLPPRRNPGDAPARFVKIAPTAWTGRTAATAGSRPVRTAS